MCFVLVLFFGVKEFFRDVPLPHDIASTKRWWKTRDLFFFTTNSEVLRRRRTLWCDSGTGEDDRMDGRARTPNFPVFLWRWRFFFKHIKINECFFQRDEWFPLRLFQHTELEHTPSNLYQQAISRDSFHNWLRGLLGVCDKGVCCNFLGVEGQGLQICDVKNV